MRLSYECLEVTGMQPESTTASGTLVIHSSEVGENDYLLDLTSMTPTRESIGLTAVVSPDNRKLAVVVDNQIEIRDANWNLLSSFPKEADWQIERWLDGYQLLIDVGQNAPQAQSWRLPQLLVVNATTGESTLAFDATSIPGIQDRYDPSLDFGSPSRLVPDSSLSVMIFPARGDADEVPVVLWDLERHVEIGRLTNLGPFGGTPTWSPDGSKAVVAAPIRFTTDKGAFDNLAGEVSVGGAELLSISRQGKVRRLSYVTSLVIAAPSAPAWSPDGRFLAYWLAVRDDANYPGERLAVVDTETGLVTNYCVAGYRREQDGQSPAPIWSPDGKWIALTVPNATDVGQTDILLVDLAEKRASQVADHATLLGWMRLSP